MLDSRISKTCEKCHLSLFDQLKSGANTLWFNCDSTVMHLNVRIAGQEGCQSLPQNPKSHQATDLQKHILPRAANSPTSPPRFRIGHALGSWSRTWNLRETVPKAFTASSSSGKGPTTKKSGINPCCEQRQFQRFCLPWAQQGNARRTPSLYQPSDWWKKQGMNHTCQNWEW